MQENDSRWDEMQLACYLRFRESALELLAGRVNVDVGLQHCMVICGFFRDVCALELLAERFSVDVFLQLMPDYSSMHTRSLLTVST